MRYCSLDLETTSLTPHPEHVLMLSAVIEDTARASGTAVERLEHFTRFVRPPEPMRGDAYALAMNGWILDIISGRDVAKNARGHAVVSTSELWEEFSAWLSERFGEGNRVVVAGKNVAGFDLQFFPPEIKRRFHNRALDPGSMFVDWSASAPPSLGDLLARFGASDAVAHDAYDDAMDVIRVIRAGTNGYARAP